MRFLLHPKTSKAVKATATYVISKGSTASSVHPASAIAVSKLSPDGTSTARSTTATSPQVCFTGRRAWGQQCSPECGCIVRFEAKIGNSTVESATYHAKRLVVVMSSSPSNGSSSSQKQQLKPGLTTKGRPMLRPCECQTLHHLSSVVLEHMVGKNLDMIKNELEFNSVRSSTAFRQAALQAQGMPVDTGGKCFDLVEEALTALLKGYLPKPRPRNDRKTSTLESICVSDNKKTLHKRLDELGMEDDDDDHGLTFPSMFWPQGSIDNGSYHGLRTAAATPPSVSSTLRMFDDDLEDFERVTTTTAAGTLEPKKLVPRDWVSYVDELYQESSA